MTLTAINTFKIRGVDANNVAVTLRNVTITVPVITAGTGMKPKYLNVDTNGPAEFLMIDPSFTAR